MRKIEAKFKIVTPLFMSGADQQKAELRVPSIKGALRFWWRALALGRLGSVERVRNVEADLFGSSDREVGQSKVLLNLTTPKSQDVIKVRAQLKYPDGTVVGPGARYLGYGLMEAFASRNKRTKEGQLTRPCLMSPVDAELSILFNPKRFKEDDDGKDELMKCMKEIQSALIAMGLFGGLGSRSRKGYGSFNLIEMKFDDEVLFKQPVDVPGLRNVYIDFFKHQGEMYEGLPEYTAFSSRTRVDILSTGNDSLKILNGMGETMQMYRSCGFHETVDGKPSERNFQNDHDWANNPNDSRWGDFHPRRVVFGLPHNYGKDSYNKELGCKPDNKKHERRASPLFIHIIQLGDGTSVGVTGIFPAKFLPDGEKIRAGNKSVTQNADYKILDEFIDGFTGPAGNKTNNPRFPNREAIVKNGKIALSQEATQ